MGAASFSLYLLFLCRLGLFAIPRANSQNSLNLFFDFRQKRRVVLQVHLGVLAPLTDALRTIAVPRSRLVDDTRFRRNVQHQRRMTDTLGIHNIELCLLERRGNLILYNFYPYVRANHVLLLLDRSNSTDIKPHRSVELQRLSTSRRLRIAK